MKINIKYLVLSVFAIFVSLNAFSWGSKGHDIVAYIAEQHLTGKARKEVGKLLGGRTMVYYANWADNVKYKDEFRHTSTWHYLNINEEDDINHFNRNPKGDAETAINLLVSQLGSDTLDIEEEADALKLLIHIVGDIHCPMHLGRERDKGGNAVQIKFFNQGTNLHRLWDRQLLEAAHRWSYTEWHAQIDIKNKKEIQAIQKTPPIDWVSESYHAAKQIYAAMPAGSKISYDEVAKYAPLIEEQLLKAGYRLASLLNAIYG